MGHIHIYNCHFKRFTCETAMCADASSLPPLLPSVLYSLFLPGGLPLLLVDLVVGVTQFDLGVVRQAGGDDVQLQVFVVLRERQGSP